MRTTISRTLMALLAGGCSASVSLADETATMNLTGVQLKNATNQARSSNPDSIDPHFAYAYHITGKAKGSGVLLGALYPNPTDIAVILETLAPGSSSLLSGEACNPGGTHPLIASEQTVSGTQVILGITVTFSATITVGIDENNFAFFTMTDVVLTPASLVGSMTFTEGAATLIGLCTADFDDSGFVDTDDFDAFVGAFELGDESADIDCSGFVDTDDFDTFVRRFEAGC